MVASHRAWMETATWYSRTHRADSMCYELIDEQKNTNQPFNNSSINNSQKFTSSEKAEERQVAAFQFKEILLVYITLWLLLKDF